MLTFHHLTSTVVYPFSSLRNNSGIRALLEPDSVLPEFGKKCDYKLVGNSYETPVDLHNREVQLRYDRGRPESPVILYYQNERLGAARLLDAVANGLARRKEQA